MHRTVLFLSLFSLLSGLFAAKPIKLEQNETIVLLGNTLIERDAHEAYIETAITLSHPEKNLKFRNLGWSGDNVKGDSRGYFNANGYKDLISKVKDAKPTIILLGYGANAAWDGNGGLEKFEKEYKQLLNDLKKSTKARFIFLTPLGHEKLGYPYPDPKSYNENAKKYSQVIKKIAKLHGAPLIDLNQNFKMEDKVQLTTNSVHLNEYGYWKLSKVIAKAFGYEKPEEQVTEVDLSIRWDFKVEQKVLPFPANPLNGQGSRKLVIKGLRPGQYTLSALGKTLLQTNAKELEKGIYLEDAQTATLRQKIIEKNEMYFHAWRPQNTTYLFFFRKHEQGRNAKDIPEFLQHHAKRESELVSLKLPSSVTYHIAASSNDSPSISSNTKRKSKILKPEDEIKTFKLPKDLQVSLFAAEPMVINPTNMNWDRQGRLWVACSPNYPQVVPGHLANDFITVLEDTDGDGKADKSTIFKDKLLIPTGILPGHGGVYVANSTEFVHYKDTDGDGKADQKKVIHSGFGTEDTHHILHSPRWGQDGMLYMNQSIYIHSHIETPHGVKRLMRGGIWRYDPHTEKLDIFAYGLINSWGHTMDKWGQSFATDGAGGDGINYIFPDIYQRSTYYSRHILRGLNPGQPKICGFEILSGTHFPEKYRGLFLGNDFRGHRTLSFKVTESGSGFISKQQADLIGTGHRGVDRLGRGGGFRPIDIKMGPDGGVYLADWSNIIIQHGEVDFRDPRRDQDHGRIWKVSAKNRPLIQYPKIVGEPTLKLLKLLSSKERFIVDMAKRELIEREGKAFLPQLNAWINNLPKSQNGDYLRLQGLWLKFAVDEYDAQLTKQLLKAKDGRIRAAAVRALRDLKERMPQSLSLLKTAIVDSHPRVRLEAINTLRSFETTEAIETAMLALDHEMDHFLKYSLTLTLQKQKHLWAGKTHFPGNIKALAYALKVSNSKDALQKLYESYQAGKIDKKHEDDVMQIFATLGGKNELKILIDKATSSKDTLTQLSILKAINASKPKHKPDNLKGSLAKLLNSKDVSVQIETIQLIGHWRLSSFLNKLVPLSQSSQSTLAIASIESMAKLGGKQAVETLVKLIQLNQKPPISIIALSSLVGLNQKKAIELTPAFLKKVKSDLNTEKLFNAYIKRRGGAMLLAKALEGQSIPSYVAMTGIQQANISGQKLDHFIKVLQASGQLKPMKQILSPKEMKALMTDVHQRGNPSLGESIYRRKSLACINCHAIGGVGPEIGPDLISLGASAPVDYIVESLLQPGKKIKEGYHMVMVETKAGLMLSGTQVSADRSSVVIRDPAGNKQSISRKDIKKHTIIPTSMMPPGLTASLNNEEFIHLISFLSQLGKTGDYKMSTKNYLRTVHTLTPDSKELKSMKANPSAWIKKAKSLSWQKGLAKVNGFIPLHDESVLSSKQASLLRLDLKVIQAGKIALKFSQSQSIKLYNHEGKELSLDKQNTLALNYSKGDFPLFIFLDPTKCKDLRIELLDHDSWNGQAKFLN